jgi:hypothetical protein
MSKKGEKPMNAEQKKEVDERFCQNCGNIICKHIPDFCPEYNEWQPRNTVNIESLNKQLHERLGLEMLLHRDIEILKNENLKLKSEIERAEIRGSQSKFYFDIRHAELTGARELAERILSGVEDESLLRYSVEGKLAEMEGEKPIVERGKNGS